MCSMKTGTACPSRTPWFFVGSTLLIFLFFCDVFYGLFIFILRLVLIVASTSELFILDCPFSFLSRVFVVRFPFQITLSHSEVVNSFDGYWGLLIYVLMFTVLAYFHFAIEFI